MELFWKASAGIVISSILCLCIDRKEYFSLVTMGACILTGVLVLQYIEPVIDCIQQLGFISRIPKESVQLLLHALGICLASEFCAMLCSNSGNAVLEKCIHLLGNSAILWLSLPALQQFVNLIQQILGDT